MTAVASAAADRALAEFDAPPPDPIWLLGVWLREADEQQVREPTAIALATADAEGRVSNRIVRTLVEPGPEGLLFTSHDSSRKAKDFTTTGQASGLFYWRELGRQIEVAGPVQAAPDHLSDELWAKRPRAVNAVSTLSHQSDPLDSDKAFRNRVGELAAGDEPLPRPDRWRAYRLVPDAIEFWAKDPGGVHRRLRYERDGTGWTIRHLQP